MHKLQLRMHINIWQVSETRFVILAVFYFRTPKKYPFPVSLRCGIRGLGRLSINYRHEYGTCSDYDNLYVLEYFFYIFLLYIYFSWKRNKESEDAHEKLLLSKPALLWFNGKLLQGEKCDQP